MEIGPQGKILLKKYKGSRFYETRCSHFKNYGDGMEAIAASYNILYGAANRV